MKSMLGISIAFVTFLTVASPAFANDGEPAPRDIAALLNAIDVVPPSRDALEADFPNARAQLEAYARDTAQTDYLRLRALSLLSFYPDDATRGTLLSLSQDARTEVRGAALYTFGRTFGTIDPTVTPVLLRAAERDSAAEVRDDAVRALRWVAGPAAVAALTRIQSVRPELASIAKITLERRAKALLSIQR